MKKKLTDKIVNGKLPKIRNQIADLLSKHDGEWCEVTFQIGDKRTNPQNRMWWGMIIPQVQTALKAIWGYEPDKNEVHEILKSQSIILKKSMDINGKFVSYNGSTTELMTSEFSDLVQEIDDFCLEYFGFRLELPD